jgi:hypothetical protein
MFYAEPVRWSGQQVNSGSAGGSSSSGNSGEGGDGAGGEDQLALFDSQTVTRRVDTPGFRGVTFYEVRAKSVLNRVPGTDPMFRWTINPYRGCTHGCVYSHP